ncbi:MAG: Bax inhibitor-1/YccA family protein [Bacteroidota bacterium]
MENPFSSTQQKTIREQQLSDERVNVFMRQVYVTMALGLVITGLTAWFVSQSPALINLFLSGGILTWVVMLAPLGMVFFLAARINKMSFQAASTTFAIYSLVNGISFATIFMVYELGAISRVFFITAGTFGAMALIGLTTKVDLSKMGSIMYMALIGLIIAMVVNMFMGSSTLDYIISCAGVLIFCGLTAYDNQMLLNVARQAAPGTETTNKIALMGALNLYLDFINLFLFLLRFFGGGDD